MKRKAANTGGTAMRKIGILGLVGILALVLSGCGGGGSSGPNLVVHDILSKGGADDGDIGRDALGVFTVFTSDIPPNTVFVTDDPADNRRGFLSFSIISIPVGATIQSAIIFLPILRATPVTGSSVGLLVDMVSFPPLNTLVTQLNLDAVYFTTPILLGPSISVFPGDAGTDKTFDATDAMLEANRLGFSTLQIRLIGVSGDVVIDDLLDVNGNGTPLLRVEYF